jgi:formylglycine-generating enzyme required for sulfatase activity
MQEGCGDEVPVRDVRLSDYMIDRTDVTVECFRRFWAAGHPAPPGPMSYPGGQGEAWEGAVTEPLTASNEACTWSAHPGREHPREQHPINCVTWATSQAYCAWMGGRLPTEAEWEYAARGQDGGMYPWGDDSPAHNGMELCWAGGNAPVDGTCDVGKFRSSDSPLGVSDMAGNVWQWVADRYSVTYEGAPGQDPLGQSATLTEHGRTGTTEIPNRTRVIRGGTWLFDSPIAIRSTLRQMGNPEVRLPTIGFRCAYSGTTLPGASHPPAGSR